MDRCLQGQMGRNDVELLVEVMSAAAGFAFVAIGIALGCFHLRMFS